MLRGLVSNAQPPGIQTNPSIENVRQCKLKDCPASTAHARSLGSERLEVVQVGVGIGVNLNLSACVHESPPTISHHTARICSGGRGQRVMKAHSSRPQDDNMESCLPSQVDYRARVPGSRSARAYTCLIFCILMAMRVPQHVP
jgi:hypothetical protein